MLGRTTRYPPSIARACPGCGIPPRPPQHKGVGGAGECETLHIASSHRHLHPAGWPLCLRGQIPEHQRPFLRRSHQHPFRVCERFHALAAEAPSKAERLQVPDQNRTVHEEHRDAGLGAILHEPDLAHRPSAMESLPLPPGPCVPKKDSLPTRRRAPPRRCVHRGGDHRVLVPDEARHIFFRPQIQNQRRRGARWHALSRPFGKNEHFLIVQERRDSGARRRERQRFVGVSTEIAQRKPSDRVCEDHEVA
eukprot:scaffold1123_cov253-Pinguiococcus_pyrenoidosus.AAC.5